MPFFSIIIPLYNKENFIVKTINSALRQTFSNFEIIIINDGSTDESLNRLKIFNDRRIRIFDIPNSGVSVARNYGIKKSKSKMIALLDSDDIWEKNHLEEPKVGTLFQEKSFHQHCRGLKSGAQQGALGPPL